MTEDVPGKLKVVSSGSQAPAVVPWRHIAAFVLMCVAMVYLLRNGPHHLWRSIGPGSSSYRACFALIERDVQHFEFRSVHAKRTGDVWSFRFELDLLTADNSPAGEAVRRCNGRDGDVAIEGY